MVLGYKETGRKEGSGTYAAVNNPSAHDQTIDKIVNSVNSSHCPTDVIEQIRQTKTDQEVNSLGYGFMIQYPVLADVIFKETGDLEGRKKLLRDVFLISEDRILQTYAYGAISDVEPGLLKEFGDYLVAHENPELACQVFAEIDDKEGLERALDKISETDPDKGKTLRRFYDSIIARIRRAVRGYFTPGGRYRPEIRQNGPSRRRSSSRLSRKLVQG